jgi:hypothetical protein
MAATRLGRHDRAHFLKGRLLPIIASNTINRNALDANGNSPSFHRKEHDQGRFPELRFSGQLALL